jgi:hypothetical protein
MSKKIVENLPGPDREEMRRVGRVGCPHNKTTTPVRAVEGH